MKVEIRNLCKTFGRHKAVDNLSFSFQSGEVIGFVGPNGAGKTTTMRIMATIDEPTSGDVLIDGISVVDYPERARRRIGFMQDSLPEFNDITVHEYLDFFGRSFGLRGAELSRVLHEVEEFTGLGDFNGKVLSALSKGMKQRVSLARAMVHNPDLLIMDEPANGLDPRARIELRELVSVLAEHGKAVLISSHILSELEEMCSGVQIIERGVLLTGGNVSDISASVENDNSGRQYKALVRAADAEGQELLRRCLEIPGVSGAVPHGAYIEMSFEGGDSAAALIIASLVGSGVKVVEFKFEEKSLEDIFMSVTKGRLA